MATFPRSSTTRSAARPRADLDGDLLAGSQAASAEGFAGAGATLLVQWRASASADQRLAIHRELGGNPLRSIHTLPMERAGEGVLDVIQAPEDNTARERLLTAYRQRPEVAFAEPDYQVGIQLVSNDPSLASLWGLQSSGAGAKAAAAWARGFTGSTRTVVGVVDTGIDYTHPDLYLNIWLNQGELKGLGFFASLVDDDQDGLITFRDLNTTANRTVAGNRLTDWNANGYIDAGDLLDNRSGWEDGLDNDGNGYRDDLIGWDFANNDNDPYDDNSHGTHVAGSIGAIGGNGLGVAGVNWQVQMAGLKFLGGNGSGSISNALLAVDYFTTAKLLSEQRGETGLFVGTNNSWSGGGFSQAFASAIERARQQDLLFIAAAGNGGSDGIGDNNDPTANVPSNYTSDNVLAVAALTSGGSLASFSNYGATSVDLGAPGAGILSTVPGGGYASYNGTSMATPHVTGAAALLKAASPATSSAQIRQALLDSAAPTASLSGKTVTGGRLDIAAALDRLGLVGQPTTPTPPTNLTIWGTTGNDVITGKAGNDQLAGVSQSGTSASNLGRRQIDTLTGGAGMDLFLLADSRGSFYDDGSTGSQGFGDYARITDFNPAEDKLQLKRDAQYLVRNANGGTEFFLGDGDFRFSSRDELIARLDGVNLLPDARVYILGTTNSWTTYV